MTHPRTNNILISQVLLYIATHLHRLEEVLTATLYKLQKS